jgi:hypothetical protein
MKLSDTQRAKIKGEIRLRRLLRDKVICKRYKISRSTLTRLQREELEERPRLPSDVTVNILDFGVPQRRVVRG